MRERTRIPRKREKATGLPSVQSETLQRGPFASQPDVDEMPPIVQEVLSSSGQPLDTDIRTFMEPRFGHDFSRIRIHTDECAIESAQAVHALAYTVGNDIVFSEGQYIPDTLAGKHLLAHELTHSVQQSAGPLEKNTDGSSHTIMNRSRDAAEQEAYLAPIHVQTAGHMIVQQRVAQPMLYRTAEGETVPQRVYTITLRIPPRFDERHYSNVSVKGTLHILTNLLVRINDLISAGEKGRHSLEETREEQFIVGSISDLFSGARLPPESIWDEAYRWLKLTHTFLDHLDIEHAVMCLQNAAEAWQRAQKEVTEYREGTVSGAETAVIGLKVVEAVGAIAATGATGGMAAEFELGALGAATVEGLTAGGYTALKEGAVQASGKYLFGLRDHWDIGELVRHGVSDAVTSFIGKLLGDYAEEQLTNAINEAFRRYLFEKLSTETLKQMGIPLQVFLHHYLHLIAEFLGKKGGELLATAVNVVVEKAVKEGKTLSRDEWADAVVKEMFHYDAYTEFTEMLEHLFPAHESSNK